MDDQFERAQALATLGAPLEAQAMALLLAWQQTKETREGLTAAFLASAQRAAGVANDPYPMLPEIERLLELDGALPDALQHHSFVPPPAAVYEPDAPTVDWTVEAITPWLTSPLPFAQAAQLGDKAEDWARAALQITGVHYEALPPNGSLWRGRLTKTTDFGVPLVTGLVSKETIEITARGSDGPDGSGYRRYDYVLFSAETGPGLLALVEDTGWIEMRGDRTGTLLQIQKRATVIRPAVDDPYRAILSAGFAAELWLWANGFFEAAGGPSQAIYAPPPPQSESKIVNRGPVTNVAVLGGGPAGLACAWLLSGPSRVDEHGVTHRAWRHEDESFDLRVALFEKQCRLGGKAASGRRIDTEKFRIEEHGLHVLMGFYANLLEVLKWLGATDTLEDVSTTRVPYGNGSGLGDAWNLVFKPWKTRSDDRTLNTWLQDRAEGQGIRPLALRFDAATHAARPLLRAFVEMGRQVAEFGAPAPVPKDSRELHNLLLQWLFVRSVFAELGVAFRLSNVAATANTTDVRAGRELAPMARLLRAMARSALPAQDPNPQVRLTSEVVELGTTIAIGLDEGGFFPMWAIDDPNDLLEENYAAWVRAVQSQDALTIGDWLAQHGVAKGFAENSRLLCAVTAGLFTTPGQIGAGTFVNGLARLLLTYVGAPYKRMRGGTGEAVIGPLYQALLANKVDIQLGTVVTGVSIVEDTVVAAKLVKKLNCVPGDFAAPVPCDRPGWCLPLCSEAVTAPSEVERAFHAFVLAIPPFGGPLPGLPEALAADLAKIESRATIGLQHWTEGDPRYAKTIISGFDGPLQCAAAMDHLTEGPHYLKPPVYACGDVDDEVARRWCLDDTERDNWLLAHAGQLQEGNQAHPPHLSVNHEGSERYVSANPSTQHARRYVYETGVQNLWLAGDWTQSALACGSIEAAVTSGLEAARHILQTLGCDVAFPIVGPIVEKEKP